jgi:hypothetical protein
MAIVGRPDNTNHRFVIFPTFLKMLEKLRNHRYMHGRANDKQKLYKYSNLIWVAPIIEQF